MTQPSQHQPSPQTERDAVRQKLQRSLDTLADRANLQLQMQKDPLKMIGGASGVGLALGLLVGRQLRRSKKIYVDAGSPKAHQKALSKAQARSNRGGASIGGALMATAATLAFKVLQDRVIAPRLEGLADQLMNRMDERQSERQADRPGTPGIRSQPVTLDPSETEPRRTVVTVDTPVDLHKDHQR